MLVTDLVCRDFENLTKRNHAVIAELQVITILQHLTVGQVQQCDSDDIDPAQPTINNVISQAFDAQTQPHIIAWFIKMPATQRKITVCHYEYRSVDAIDGTHIRIIALKKNGPVAASLPFFGGVLADRIVGCGGICLHCFKWRTT